MAVMQRSKRLTAELFYHSGTRHVAEHLAVGLSRDPGCVEVTQAEPQEEDRLQLLATIESEIIPRLMMAHRPSPESARCAESRLPPTGEELLELARIAVCHDLPRALALIETLCRQGLSLETILVDLLGPTARLLGDQWLADQRSFTEVSAGLGTLQQLVHILGPSFAPAVSHRGLVVLMAAPGEQHTLGLYLIGEFLRRAGWGVQVSPSLSASEALALVAAERVEMLGISVSNERLLKPLAPLLTAVRKASCNPSMKLALGGSLDLSDYAVRHGASFHARDPREVVQRLERHASLRERRN